MGRFSVIKVCLTAGLAMLLISCGSNSTPPPAPKPLFGNSSLNGAYVFTAAGTDSADGDYFAAGSFQADGTSKAAGIEDVNFGSGVDAGVPVSGSYFINSNGSGTLQLADVNGTTDAVQIMLAQTGPSTVNDFDNTGGTGTLEKQDLTGFVRSGSYTFQVSGSDNLGALSITGTFTADSLGNVSGGKQDVTSAGNTTTGVAFTGVMEPFFEGGRGRILLGGNSFSYYVVSANKIVLAGLDQTVFLHGTASK